MLNKRYGASTGAWQPPDIQVANRLSGQGEFEIGRHHPLARPRFFILKGSVAHDSHPSRSKGELRGVRGVEGSTAG